MFTLHLSRGMRKCSNDIVDSYGQSVPFQCYGCAETAFGSGYYWDDWDFEEYQEECAKCEESCMFFNFLSYYPPETLNLKT